MGTTIGWRVNEVIRLKVKDGKQSGLVAILGCSDDAVTDWVNNKTQPATKWVLLMAEKLGISPSWLLLHEGPMCRGGVAPRSGEERTTLETAESAHREYVIDRLATEFPRELVEDVVPSGPAMLATSLDLCRLTVSEHQAAAAYRDASGQVRPITSTTAVAFQYGPMLPGFGKAKRRKRR